MVCQNCGCLIVNGGHKSAFRKGWSSSGYVCDNCYEEDQANAKVAFTLAGFVVRLIVGLIVGVVESIGIVMVTEKFANVTGLGESGGDGAFLTFLCLVEGAAIVLFITGKIGKRRFNVALFRFVCSIVAYFAFWLAIVWGVVAYLFAKFAL